MRERHWWPWDSWNSPERLPGWDYGNSAASARVPNWNLAVILVLTLVTFGLMARASNIGGEIRHAEIRASQGTVVETRRTRKARLARTVGSFVTETPWMWPTCETLHFIGLTLLLGVVFLVDLRVLGVMKGVSFASLHRLLPWAAIGFGVNVITGMLFFVGIPGQYIQNRCLLLENGTGDAGRGERIVLYSS